MPDDPPDDMSLIFNLLLIKVWSDNIKILDWERFEISVIWNFINKIIANDKVTPFILRLKEEIDDDDIVEYLDEYLSIKKWKFINILIGSSQ